MKWRVIRVVQIDSSVIAAADKQMPIDGRECDRPDLTLVFFEKTNCTFFLHFDVCKHTLTVGMKTRVFKSEDHKERRRAVEKTLYLKQVVSPAARKKSNYSDPHVDESDEHNVHSNKNTHSCNQVVKVLNYQFDPLIFLYRSLFLSISFVIESTLKVDKRPQTRIGRR